MDFEHQKNIVRLVLSDHVADPDLVLADILRSLRIADILRSPAGAASQPEVATQTKAAPKSLPSVGLLGQSAKPGPVLIPSGAKILSFAPPVAGTEEDFSDPGDVDYWESKPGRGDGCERLTAHLRSILPQSITIKVPAVPEPLELVLGIGSPGIRFVHVGYTIPGDTLGPRVTFMTSQREFEVSTILGDIADQAASMYSGEKRQITPAPVKPPPPPSPAELQAMLEKDRRNQESSGVSGRDAQLAAEDAANWAEARRNSSQWG